MSEVERLDRLSTMLDSRYRIPGTQVRFGWDFLLGVIPGVGDVATLVPSGFLIYRAMKLGVRKRTIGRMMANTGLDFAVGAVPVLGDLFDLVYKANNRNFKLLRNELEAQSAKSIDSVRE